MTRIAAQSIWFRQAEGRIHEIAERTFEGPDPWGAADAHIATCRSRMPHDMLGYYKCDFKITFQDGFVYEGRYELSRHERVPLCDHVRRFCEISRGRWRPSRMSEEQYAEYLTWDHVKKHRETFARILDTYQLGGPT